PHRLRFLHHSFFTDTPPTELYTLSLHDALPIFTVPVNGVRLKALVSQHAVVPGAEEFAPGVAGLWLPPERTFSSLAPDGDENVRSEEHTSELQSRGHLVCRLLLEKKKQKRKRNR